MGCHWYWNASFTVHMPFISILCWCILMNSEWLISSPPSFCCWNTFPSWTGSLSSSALVVPRPEPESASLLVVWLGHEWEKTLAAGTKASQGAQLFLHPPLHWGWRWITMTFLHFSIDTRVHTGVLLAAALCFHGEQEANCWSMNCLERKWPLIDRPWNLTQKCNRLTSNQYSCLYGTLLEPRFWHLFTVFLSVTQRSKKETYRGQTRHAMRHGCIK